MFPYRGRGNFPGFPGGPRFPMGGMPMNGGMPPFNGFGGPFSGGGGRPFRPGMRGGRGGPGRGGHSGPPHHRQEFKGGPPNSSTPDNKDAGGQTNVKSETQTSNSSFDRSKKAGPQSGQQQQQHEPEYDDSLCILDWYNSDLNLKIKTEDFCSVEAISKGGFGYMWAGARATYGASKGRVCFEVRIDSNNSIDHLEGEQSPNVLRVGWSISESNLQLGEVKNSFGYGGTGKISENCAFKNYGIKFGVGDVVGTFLDLSGEHCTIKYTVNGKDQGIAFRFQKRDLKGKPLFPHVLTKNQNFTVNFGQLPAPLFTLLTGYTPIGQLDVADGLVRGPVPPKSKEECEVLMMIGLPGAGKTYWAEKYAKENEEKNYNILGTNNLIEKMKVNGLSRKRNYHGRWEVLIKKCTECFNEILDMAAKRRRNYILDQTNVFPTARNRKLKDFKAFSCKAVVVVPPDEEFRRRVAEREAIEGKEIPDQAVLNMKSNFVLPEHEEQFFVDVMYTELAPDEAHKTVNSYNEEARAAGHSIMGGVRSFKMRNETKRREQNIPLPGRHIKLAKSTSTTTTTIVSSTGKSTTLETTTVKSEEKVQASTSTSSYNSNDKAAGADVKPEPGPSASSGGGGGSGRVKDIIRENRDQVKSSRSRSRSRSRGGSRRSSKDRRRSRSRDRGSRRSGSRDRFGRSERNRRSRSGDRKYDRDRNRNKRSRSRSRDRGTQKFKAEQPSPWSRDSQGGSGGTSSSFRGRGGGGGRSSERPPYNSDASSRGGGSGSGGDRIKSENDSFSSFRGRGGGGRGGRGGRGGFDSGPGRGRGGYGNRGGLDPWQQDQSGDWNSGQRGGGGGSDGWSVKKEPEQRPGSRNSLDDGRGSRRPGLLGEAPRGGPGGAGGGHPLDQQRGGAGSGPPDFDQQIGNNEFFNNRKNFGPDSRGPPPSSTGNSYSGDGRGRPGGSGGGGGDNSYGGDQRGRSGDSSSSFGRNNFGPDNNSRGRPTGDSNYGPDDRYAGNNRYGQDDRSRPGGGVGGQYGQEFQGRSTGGNDRFGSDGRGGGNFGADDQHSRGGDQWNMQRSQDRQFSQGNDNRQNMYGRNEGNHSYQDQSNYDEQGGYGDGGNDGGYGGGGDNYNEDPADKIRNLDDEFASRMERKMACYDEDRSQGGGNHQYGGGSGNYGSARGQREFNSGGGGGDWRSKQENQYGGSSRFNSQSDYPDRNRPGAGGNIGGGRYGHNRDSEQFDASNRFSEDGGGMPDRQYPSGGGGQNFNSQNFNGPPPFAGRGNNSYGLPDAGSDYPAGGMPPGRGGPGNDFPPGGRRPDMSQGPPDGGQRYPGGPGGGGGGGGGYRDGGNFQYDSRFNAQGQPGRNPDPTPSSSQRIPPPKIPNWDNQQPPSTIQPPPRDNWSSSAAGQPDRFPITSDGKGGVGMGYSVQYHGDPYEGSATAAMDPQGRRRAPPPPPNQGGGGSAMYNNQVAGGDRKAFSGSDDRFSKPSNQSSRLNMDIVSIPGMNPPAPDAAASNPPGGVNANQQQPTSGPDYAALLQYLQYYQKQMGSEEEKRS